MFKNPCCIRHILFAHRINVNQIRKQAGFPETLKHQSQLSVMRNINQVAVNESISQSVKIIWLKKANPVTVFKFPLIVVQEGPFP